MGDKKGTGKWTKREKVTGCTSKRWWVEYTTLRFTWIAGPCPVDCDSGFCHGVASGSRSGLVLWAGTSCGAGLAWVCPGPRAELVMVMVNDP